MREIKFRCWDTSTEKMVKPTDVNHSDRCIVRPTKQGFRMLNGKESHFILMQYTGLEDKNGKEIYDGDILLYIAKKNSKKGRKKDEKHHWEILWNENGQWDMRRKEAKLQMRLGKRMSQGIDFEIIGNIYQNPELLKS